MEDVARAPSLNDVLGQNHAVEILRSAARTGRVHHAWIFAGPAGVGKHLTARAFAALLLDPTTGPNLAGAIEPDPESATQRMITSDAHPDLHLISKELARFSEDRSVRERKLITIPKDVIEKRLLEPIALAPTIKTDSLASKVFIVNEAELLDRSTTNAPVQNSILKTLEEPAPGSVIILVTSAEDRLLATIRSRCQRVAFSLLDEVSMREWLDRALPGIDEDEQAWLLGDSEGSPGQAMLAHETGMHEWARALDPRLDGLESGKAPVDLGETMAGLIDEWAKAWVKQHAGASKEAANHAATGHLLSMIARRSRRRLRASAEADDWGGQERAMRTLDLLGDARRHVTANVSIAHAMENLAAQMGE